MNTSYKWLYTAILIIVAMIFANRAYISYLDSQADLAILRAKVDIESEKTRQMQILKEVVLGKNRLLFRELE